MKRQILIGTSGFGYREWKGKFFPKDLPADRYLHYYAERFPTVEINSSFYRMPTEKALLAWAKDVPAGFLFSFKAPQAITHFKKLRSVKKDVAQFDRVTSVLGDRRGALLFQTPPWLKADIPLLEDFLAVLPKAPCALEFRHPSWFTEDVSKRLTKAKRALCFNDADVENCPRWDTAPFGYWRLRRVEYTGKELGAIAAAAGREPAKRLFVYFKHEETASGPRWAGEIRERLGGNAYKSA
jgi:uncharacterized protein YecE (DUF72 family)